ncbi:hypothetical protein E1A91_D07G113300v1 [Gossypium mustelinum]|uniref:Outer envelope pore protein 16, chloroplastic n=2 Tax=Gossypium TaxID=3633 RepID=A0A0D2QNQ9_GOSRA|nr:outer envelope pore protein 16, chloroplastic isoform X2 [Gossypium raimondii]XP_017624385.1 outer envelope pore protein 16, chloroplastic isoform X2 [Gossypium arboreum]KJB08880.1 hypothetical protein B456_001G110700 [Gossypium raimondii]TYI73180.1 hypothetical protein E1A91_D07G113300v1 [Gossypium mustelinum]
MPSTRFLGSLSTPRVDITIDTGNLFFNHALEGFLKIGSVAATRSIAEDSFKAINGGKLSKHCLERSLKKMCKEGAYWGSVAGVYVGMEYGVGRIRGTWDWVCSPRYKECHDRRCPNRSSCLCGDQQ